MIDKKKSRRRKTLIILAAVVLVLTVSLQFPAVQRLAARASAATFIAVFDRSNTLSYESLEFSPQFGSYFVVYRDQDGHQVAFEVQSKRFPFFVIYDPLQVAP